MHRFGPLTEALRETDREIERIAAGLVRAGVPLWTAIERAREIYRRRQTSNHEAKHVRKR